MRSPHAFHRTPLSPLPSPCLSYFFRLFSGAAAATLQTTNNFPFSGTWLFQILVRLYTLTLPMPPPPLPPPLPCHTERPVEPKPSSLASPATCSQSYTLSNSSASLLSLCFVAHIVVPVCHHMANGYPQQKERGEREEVRVWEKKVKVHPQQGPQLRDQQKHHSCSRTRRAVFQRVTQRQSSDWMQCE